MSHTNSVGNEVLPPQVKSLQWMMWAASRSHSSSIAHAMTPVVIETIGPVVYGVNTVSQTLDCDPVVLNLLPLSCMLCKIAGGGASAPHMDCVRRVSSGCSGTFGDMPFQANI